MKVHVIQHVEFENPGVILDWVDEIGGSVSFTRIYNNDDFSHIPDYDMLVVMGGPMSVYEENVYPWIKDERDFIKKSIDAGKKVLGICLGAQMIASALGAGVYPGKEKEIGFFSVNRTSSDSYFLGDCPDNFVCFHWHGDTFDIPSGAVNIAGTLPTPNQAFEIGNSVLALQFHLEVKAANVDIMLKKCGDDLKNAGKYIQESSLIRERSETSLGESISFMKMILDKFI